MFQNGPGLLLLLHYHTPEAGNIDVTQRPTADLELNQIQQVGRIFVEALLKVVVTAVTILAKCDILLKNRQYPSIVIVVISSIVIDITFP
jgi:hypothetical protein